MPTLKEARNYASCEFLASSFLNKNNYNENSAFLDADILLSHILKKNRAWLLIYSDFDFSPYFSEFTAMVKKRVDGLPIAYITGVKEFYGRNFFVSRNGKPSVLIPKPDTEILLDEAICFLSKKISDLQKFDKIEEFEKHDLSILDICTGSGCIGISLMAEISNLKFSLVLADVSDEALEICKKNAESILEKSTLSNVFIRNIDLRKDSFVLKDDVGHVLIEKYDIITANPPYVPSRLSDELLEDGRSEPRLALDGGEDGLELIRPLANKITTSLKNNGTAFVEVGEYHAKKAGDIFKVAGFSRVQIVRDLAGKQRVLKIQF